LLCFHENNSLYLITVHMYVLRTFTMNISYATEINVKVNIQYSADTCTAIILERGLRFAAQIVQRGISESHSTFLRHK